MRRDTEITAGIPGLGLSGLFVLLSALTLPLTRRLAPQHGPQVRIGRLFWLAVLMIGAIVLTWQVIIAAIAAVPRGDHGSAVGTPTAHAFWRFPVIVISAAILVLVIAGAEALLHLIGSRPTPAPPPITSTALAALSTDDQRAPAPSAHDKTTREVYQRPTISNTICPVPPPRSTEDDIEKEMPCFEDDAV